MTDIGLIAGRGRLPFDVIEEIKLRDCQPVVIGLRGEVDPELSKIAARYITIAPGFLGEMIEYFQKSNVKELVFAGKVGKEALFTEGFDLFFQGILKNLPVKNDDAILGAIVNAFEENGLKVAKQTDYLHNLMISPGSLNGVISEAELADIHLGFQMAKASGGLDIGQSVVVKQGVVLAVEAIEGTDQAIIRGGQLGGPGSVVVKVSKPNQDERFDVPTIGRTTLESMIQVKAAILGIEAQKTIMTQKAEIIKLAAEHGIKIIALTEADISTVINK